MSILKLTYDPADTISYGRLFEENAILEDELPGALPNLQDKKEETQDPTEEEQLAAEAKEKGITVEELQEQKETEALEAEAKEKGITVDELIAQKEEEAEEAYEEGLKKEAESRGITVDQLKEEKETERLNAKAKELGKTVEEVKALEEEERKAAEEDDDLFKISSEEDKGGTQNNDNLFTEELVSGLDGIVLEEGETLTAENFKDIWNKSMESAKQKFDLSNQPEQVISVVEHLNAHGDLMDFYNNPTIREADRFLALSNEDKFREVNIHNLVSGGMDADEALKLTDQRIEDMSEDDIKKAADGYDEEIKAVRNIELNKVASKSKEFRERNKMNAEKVAKAERDAVVKIVEKMDSYRGFEISPEAKTSIIDAIQSGRFLDVINKSSAKAKLIAFMELQFGEKINERNKKSKTQDGYRRGFRKATEKTFGKQKPGSSTGSQRQNQGLQGFDEWKDLEG